MKIETRDDAAAAAHSLAPPQSRDRGLIARAALVIALAVCLIVALRWALNTTNANARQLSTNLTQLQDGFEKPSEGAPTFSRLKAGKTTNNQGADGPTLEPADSR